MRIERPSDGMPSRFLGLRQSGTVAENPNPREECHACPLFDQLDEGAVAVVGSEST